MAFHDLESFLTCEDLPEIFLITHVADVRAISALTLLSKGIRVRLLARTTPVVFDPRGDIRGFKNTRGEVISGTMTRTYDDPDGVITADIIVKNNVEDPIVSARYRSKRYKINGELLFVNICGFANAYATIDNLGFTVYKLDTPMEFHEFVWFVTENYNASAAPANTRFDNTGVENDWLYRRLRVTSYANNLPHGKYHRENFTPAELEDIYTAFLAVFESREHELV